MRRKPRRLTTGRLQSLRLFSTLLPITLKWPDRGFERYGMFSPSAEEKTRQYFKPKKQADSKAQNENDDVPQYPLPTAPHAVGNSIPIRPNARCCGVVSEMASHEKAGRSQGNSGFIVSFCSLS
jgi:hypothetical protein